MRVCVCACMYVSVFQSTNTSALIIPFLSYDNMLRATPDGALVMVKFGVWNIEHFTHSMAAGTERRDRQHLFT